MLKSGKRVIDLTDLCSDGVVEPKGKGRAVSNCPSSLTAKLKLTDNVQAAAHEYQLSIPEARSASNSKPQAPLTPVTATRPVRSRREVMAAYNAAHPEIEEQEQPKTEVSYNYTPPEFGGEAGNVKQEEEDAPTGTSRGQASMVRFYSQEQQPPSNIGQYNYRRQVNPSNRTAQFGQLDVQQRYIAIRDLPLWVQA
jgi:hypothetical protein